MKGLSKSCFSKKCRPSCYCLRREPIARVAGSIVLLMALVLSFIGNAIAEDTDFLVWNLPKTTGGSPGSITIPADGYLGIRVEYEKPQNNPNYSIEITVEFSYDENDCYLGGIPYDASLFSEAFKNVEPVKGRIQISDQRIQEDRTYYTIPEKIRIYGAAEPNVIYFDDDTPVPPGIIDFWVTNTAGVPYKLSVFWDRAFPESDIEQNRAFDKPFDLGIINAPFQFQSHIGWMLSRGYKYNGQWACVTDSNDYFKFKVGTSGYYTITYTSINDWGVDTEYYCKPGVSGIVEEDASGSRYITSGTWWLKEKDRIGPFYLSAAKTYYMDFQREFYQPSGKAFRCNASVLFSIKKEGYTKYKIEEIIVKGPDVPASGDLIYSKRQ